jgi:hypothetical protein
VQPENDQLNLQLVSLSLFEQKAAEQPLPQLVVFITERGQDDIRKREIVPTIGIQAVKCFGHIPYPRSVRILKSAGLMKSFSRPLLRSSNTPISQSALRYCDADCLCTIFASTRLPIRE